jgi:chromosome segregation ATPase
MKDISKLDSKSIHRLRNRIGSAKMDILNAHDQIKEISELAEDLERYKGYLKDAEDDLTEAKGKAPHEFGEFDMSVEDAEAYVGEAIASLAKLEARWVELCKGNTIWANLSGAVSDAGVAEEYLGKTEESYL